MNTKKLFSQLFWLFYATVLDYTKNDKNRVRRVRFFFGPRGAEEVDEAEDYEAPGSNPGQEL